MTSQYPNQNQSNLKRFNKQTVWDLPKLKMYGKPWHQGETAPSLSTYVVNGNPRFRVYMNQGSTNSNTINLDPTIYFTFLRMVEQVALSKEATKLSMQIKSNFDKGVRLEKPMITSLLSVGRDPEGLVYISAAFKGLDLAVFPFRPSFFAELIGSDGETMKIEEASKLNALGWMDTFKTMVGPYILAEQMLAEKKDDQKSPQTNSNDGWGTRDQQPQTKATSKSSWNDTDDNIPF